MERPGGRRRGEAAAVVGEHGDEEPEILRREVRRGAGRPRDGEHDAAADDGFVPGSRRGGRRPPRPGRGRAGGGRGRGALAGWGRGGGGTPGADPSVTAPIGGLPPGAAEISVPDPCLLVIFGASGDLTRRKLVPALFGLPREKLP